VARPPTLYLHIGLPKTGTTYLQKEVFPRFRSIDYLDKPLSDVVRGSPGPVYGILDRCFKRSAALWDEFGDAVFAELTGREKADPPRRSLLISDEGMGISGRKPFLLQTHLMAVRRKAAEWGYPSVKVLCSFRRQDQWLGSNFSQVSDRVAGACQDAFEAYVEETLDPGRQYYDTGIVLDYRLLFERLCDALGRENVWMHPYEHFVEDGQAYVDRVAAFLEVPPVPLRANGASRNGGAGPSGTNGVAEKHNIRSLGVDRWEIRPRGLQNTRAVKMRPARIFNALGLPTVVALRKPEWNRPSEFELTAAFKKRILDRFADTNRALADELGTDLGQFGYF
jgi:hypothetical protein